jgi:glycosyltransferase involved in cell wall biosynthesis
VGNLNPNKRFDRVIKSIRVLIDRFHESDIQLAIVGDGPHRSQLEKMVSSLRLEERVRMPGSVPHDTLRLWYSAANVFCLASSREGWPNVLLESLACGTPVVATPVGGIPEIISSSKVGLLSEGNESNIAEAIETALNRRWLSDEIAAYAKKFTWEQTALAVREVFDSVLHGEHGIPKVVASKLIVQP